MMIHFRKRFSVEDLNRINELIAERGKALLHEVVASLPDSSDDPYAGLCEQILLDDFVKPADWPEDKNWGTLTIDPFCTPADINYPTDLRLLNEAREPTERIIDGLCVKHSDLANTSHVKIVVGHMLLSSLSPNRRRHVAGRLKPQYAVSSTICNGILMQSMH
jgi:hypothetical protein